MILRMATNSGGPYLYDNAPVLFTPSWGMYKRNRMSAISPTFFAKNETVFSSDEIILSSFSRNGYSYDVLECEPIPVRYSGGFYLVDWEDVGMFIGESTVEGLKSSIYDCLDSLWRVYCEESDDVLTKDAVHLKKKVRSIIRRKRVRGDIKDNRY